MKERPIPLQPPMVQAILEGRKTQTRRVVKNLSNQRDFFAIQPNDPYPFYYRRRDAVWDSFKTLEDFVAKRCPYGKPGDRLWVRESFASVEYPHAGQVRSDVVYRADDCQLARDIEAWTHRKIVWTPSIHMHRFESRINLEITNVRVERLQEISEQDALAEGMSQEPFEGEYDRPSAIIRFNYLWDKINGKKHPWASNPWVWVVEFRRVS